MNTLVIIPAHNPERSLVSHVESLICECAQVIIVNDGSNSKFNSLFEEISALPGVTILHHAFRQGRTAALRTAFEYYDAHLKPIREMDINAECCDEYYVTWHVFDKAYAQVTAIGSVITDKIDSLADVVLQIPIRRPMR